MFKKPFSYNGRITRREYIMSVLLGPVIFLPIIFVIINWNNYYITLILPFYGWFINMQAIKRCHDLGQSGWWQFQPLSFNRIKLLTMSGVEGDNEYGPDPRTM